MTVSIGPFRAAVFLAFGLAACVGTQPKPSLTEQPAPNATTSAAAAEVLPAKMAAPASIHVDAKPDWAKRIETTGAANADGQANLSLASVQPLYQNKRNVDTVFTQVHIDGSPQTANPAGTSNVGLGYRRLLDDDFLVGVNGFYDRDWAQTLDRAGADAEIKWKSLDMTVNYYGGLGGAGPQTQALDGYDIEFGSQVPYLPWAQAKFANSGFFGTNGGTTDNYSAGMTLDLMKFVRLDMGLRDDTVTGEAGIVKLNFNLLPNQEAPRHRYALSSDPVASRPFESRDMRPHTLDKVPRVDAIQSNS